MQEAASKLEFEKAALLRDQIMELKKTTGGEKDAAASSKPMRDVLAPETDAQGLERITLEVTCSRASGKRDMHARKTSSIALPRSAASSQAIAGASHGRHSITVRQPGGWSMASGILV